MKTKAIALSDDPSHLLELNHGNVDENFDPIQDEMELGMVETLNKIIGKGDLRAKLKSKESKNGKVDPEMDHFNDFQEKDGYESTKTQFLDKNFLVLGKYGPLVFKFDAFRHTKSTLQEHEGGRNSKPVGIPINIIKLPDEKDNMQDENQMKQSFQKGKSSDFWKFSK